MEREHVGRDEFVQEPLELVVGELDVVQRLELLAEVLLQRGPIADVGAMEVLEVAEFREQLIFELAFGGIHFRLVLAPPARRAATRPLRGRGF